MPARKIRRQLAEVLQMKENQVYKWFWELMKKDKELNDLDPVVRDINQMTAVEKFEIFIDKDLRQYRKYIALVGHEAGGRELT